MDTASAKNGNSKDTTSFYFSDFPESHGAKEMLRAFALYGKVVEVVIPPKRNKWGKHFGFTRFSEVNDPRLFAVKLDNIIFGADKIHVNPPRFERERYDAKEKGVAVGGSKFEQERHIAKGKDAVGGGSRKVWKVVKEGSGKGKVDEEFPALKKEIKGGNSEHNRRDEVRGNNKKSFNRGRWIDRQQQNEQKIVYYRKKNSCDVWYNASKEEQIRLTKCMLEW